MGMPLDWVKVKIAAFEAKKQISKVTNTEIDVSGYGSIGTMLLEVHGAHGY